MKRTASARLEFDVDGPAEFVLSVAASRAYAAETPGPGGETASDTDTDTDTDEEAPPGAP